MNGRGKILSCIISGIILIIFGGLLIFLTADGRAGGSSEIMLIIIALFTAGTGVYQLYRGQKLIKGEDVGASDELRRQKEREKAEELHARRNRCKEPTMKGEICKSQRAVAPISAVCCILIGLVTSLYTGILWIGFIIGAVGIAALIYGLAGISYIRLMKEIRRLNIPLKEVNDDFTAGELFRDYSCTLNIGSDYTVYVDEVKGMIVPNRNILRAFIIREDTDMYGQAMVYISTVAHSYLILDTAAVQYKFRIPNGLEKKVIDVYMNRGNLNPECQLFFPEE